MVKKKGEVTDLTKEEEKIIDQTVKAEVREGLPRKVGVVLTGGVDSAVVLCETKRLGTDIQPIIFSDAADTKAIKSILEYEGITAEPKTFEKATTKTEKREVLQYCYENNITPLIFGNNIEEYGINSLVNDMQDWKQLSSEMNDYAVIIAEPLHPVNKSVILQKAQDYGILQLTAKPNQSPRYKKIRAEAFEEANRTIGDPDKKLVDPYAEEPTEQ